jgi:hypothetical protein
LQLNDIKVSAQGADKYPKRQYRAATVSSYADEGEDHDNGNRSAAYRKKEQTPYFKASHCVAHLKNAVLCARNEQSLL